MREIKFRAWDQVKHRVYFMDWDELCSMPTGNVFESDLIIEQFTGLKDKDGIEMFEGDIVKDKYGNIGPIVWGIGQFETIFSNEERTITTVHSMGNLNDISWEVIGNIHKNPELIA